MKKRLVLLLPLLLSCSITGAHPAWQSARVENIVGKNLTAAQLTPSEFRLQDQHDRTAIRGYAYMGCNRIGFQALFTGTDKVHFKNIHTTRMTCDDNAAEDAFLLSIEQVDNYRNDGERMILQKGNQALIILVPRARR